MCGIVGYIGTKKACPILLAGLTRLEYRGYDSAGISTIEKDGLSIMKDKGRVKNLSNLDGIDKLEGTIGIAHTRWATHGKPSKENSHPHQDISKTFSGSGWRFSGYQFVADPNTGYYLKWTTYIDDGRVGTASLARLYLLAN